MKIKSYVVITRAIEEGVSYGYNRAYKHTATPDEDQVKQAMYDAVIGSLCEVVDFGDIDEDN